MSGGQALRGSAPVIAARAPTTMPMTTTTTTAVTTGFVSPRRGQAPSTRGSSMSTSRGILALRRLARLRGVLGVLFATPAELLVVARVEGRLPPLEVEDGGRELEIGRASC